MHARSIGVLPALLLFAVTATAQDVELTERLAKVYVDQKCSVRHSIVEKGNPKGPVDDVGGRLSAEENRQCIVNPAEMTEQTRAERKPPMCAYPNLPKEHLDALVACMMSLKKK